MTWNKEKQAQLNKLQQRELTEQLSPQERQQLQQLLHELEQYEWKTLQPAIERQREEQKRLQREYSDLRSQNAGLAVLAERYENAVARAKLQLIELRNEHETLKSEYENITGQPLIPSSS